MGQAGFELKKKFRPVILPVGWDPHAHQISCISDICIMIPNSRKLIMK